jgi:hypothetical protein
MGEACLREGRRSPHAAAASSGERRGAQAAGELERVVERVERELEAVAIALGGDLNIGAERGAKRIRELLNGRRLVGVQRAATLGGGAVGRGLRSSAGAALELAD